MKHKMKFWCATLLDRSLHFWASVPFSGMIIIITTGTLVSICQVQDSSTEVSLLNPYN